MDAQAVTIARAAMATVTLGRSANSSVAPGRRDKPLTLLYEGGKLLVYTRRMHALTPGARKIIGIVFFVFIVIFLPWLGFAWFFYHVPKEWSALFFLPAFLAGMLRLLFVAPLEGVLQSTGLWNEVNALPSFLGIILIAVFYSIFFYLILSLFGLRKRKLDH